MTLKNKGVPLLCYFNYSPETPNLGQNRRFCGLCDLEIWRMTLKNNRAPLLCYIRCAHHLIANMELQSGNDKFGSKAMILFVPRDHEIWRMILKNNRAPFLCIIKLCSSFQSHLRIPNGVTVRKRPNLGKIDDFLSRLTLKISPMTLKKTQGSSSKILPFCASYYNHWWIQTGITIRKHPIWVKIDDCF